MVGRRFAVAAAVASLFLGAGRAEARSTRQGSNDRSAAAHRAHRRAADQTLAEALQGDANYASFVGGLVAAGLLADLESDGPFTVFAPSEEALALVPDGYFTKLLQDSGYSLHLENLLAFHVDAEAALEAADLTDGLDLVMANGEGLTVASDGDAVALSNSNGASATVETPDAAIASNGVLHGLGAALLPQFVFTNVYNQTGVFFQNLVATAGLEDFLQSGDVTVLVPSNDAFVGVPSDVVNDLDQLVPILQYHMIPQVLPPGQLQNGRYPTIHGASVLVEVSEDGKTVSFDGIPAQTLTLANNGIVYAIDAVLLPGQDAPTASINAEPTSAGGTTTAAPSVAPANSTGENLADLVANATDLQGLALLLEKAGLTESLRSMESGTIFAPIDLALTQMAPEFIAQLLEPEWIVQLQNLLALHAVSPDVIYTDDMAGGLVVPSLNGESLRATIGDAGSVFITGHDGTGGVIVEANVSAQNGVLHKIDSLLLPTWVDSDLLETGAQIEDISTFMDLLVSTGLDETIATGLFTLLAPTNEAMAGLNATGGGLNSTEGGLNSTGDQELVRLLQYHMVPRLVPTGLLANATLETVEGGNILVSAEPGHSVMFNDAAALFVDIPASNGLIYIIDQVLEIQEITPSPTSTPLTIAPTMAPATSGASLGLLQHGPLSLLVAVCVGALVAALP